MLREKERLQSGRGVPATVIQVFDANQQLLGKINAYNASNLSLKQCYQMEWLNKATVASEDRGFYGHFGVSIRGVFAGP